MSRSEWGGGGVVLDVCHGIFFYACMHARTNFNTPDLESEFVHAPSPGIQQKAFSSLR